MRICDFPERGPGWIQESAAANGRACGPSGRSAGFIRLTTRKVGRRRLHARRRRVCGRSKPTEVGARAPVRALTWRGESPRQAEASPACDRRLLRRGDTGWGAAGGELPVRKERFVKTRNKLNSIRPDGGTSLRALSEVRPVAHASTIGRASPKAEQANGAMSVC